MSQEPAQASVPEHIAWTGGPERVAVIDLSRPHQPPLLLHGHAAAIWAWIADGQGAPSPDVTPDELAATLHELTDLGVLTTRGPDVPRDTGRTVDSLSSDPAHESGRPRGKSQ